MISAAKNVAVNLEIISLETIEHELSNANVHSNVFHKQRGVSAHFIEPEHSTAIKYSSYFQALEGKT